MKALLLISGVRECAVFITLFIAYLRKEETWVKRRRLIIVFFIIWGANLLLFISVVITKTFS